MSAVIDRASVSYAQCQQMAEEEFCADLTEFAAWLENVDSERRPAPWFSSSISAAELMQVAFKREGRLLIGVEGEADVYRTVYQANQELRRRYLQDMSVLVNKLACEKYESLGGSQ